MRHHLLNELLYILAVCQYTAFDYTQGTKIYFHRLYTGLVLCIAGESIFLYRTSDRLPNWNPKN